MFLYITGAFSYTFDASSNDTFFKAFRWAEPTARMPPVMIRSEAGPDRMEVAEAATNIYFPFTTSWLIVFSMAVDILFTAS